MANSPNTRHVTDHTRVETTRRALAFLPLAVGGAAAIDKAQAAPSTERSPVLKLVDKITQLDGVISDMEDAYDSECERLELLGLSTMPTVYVRMKYDFSGVLPIIPPAPAQSETEIRILADCPKYRQYGKNLKLFGDQVEAHVQDLLAELEVKASQFRDAYQKSAAPKIADKIEEMEKLHDELSLELLNCHSRDLADVQAKTHVLGVRVLFDPEFESGRMAALAKLVG